MTNRERKAEIQKALTVLGDNHTTIELAGFYLTPQAGGSGLWGVFNSNDDDADLVDVLHINQFKSAREVVCYLHTLESPDGATHGDVAAPEVA